MKKKSCLLLAMAALILFSTNAGAMTPKELAAETEAYCASTASSPATPQMIIEKVNQAAQIIAKEGSAAFPIFQGKDSDYLFGGTYIWIHDMNGKMLMHPIKYKMAGKNLIGLKDKTGKRFFVTMNQVVEEKGAGWVSYMWPKPGEKGASPKVSYVKKVATPDGTDMVLGCGVYDLIPEVEKMGVEIR